MNDNNIFDVIIIGGGASGLFCSSTFSHKVNGLILEKTKQAGTKLLMSGGGQCNITHGGSIKDFVFHYGDHGSKVRSCLYKHNNLSLIDFLSANGIKTIQREDGKVFPESFDARQVLDMLLEKSFQSGFRLLENEEVISLKKEDHRFIVKTKKSAFYAEKVIAAVGGSSYPSTGSDGGFLTILHSDLGLDFVEPRPSLVPISVQNYPFEELSGISFTNVEMTIIRQGQKIKKGIGDLLFTHKTLSGPLILNYSRYIKVGDDIVLNYLYPEKIDDVCDRLQNLTAGSKKDPASIVSLEFHLPKRFTKILCTQAGKSTKLLASLLCQQRFSVSGLASFNVAMATAGGIALDQIKLQTMESIKVPGLFVIGEALDIDGDTGGYNLQFAFSSAKTASTNL